MRSFLFRKKAINADITLKTQDFVQDLETDISENFSNDSFKEEPNIGFDELQPPNYDAETESHLELKPIGCSQLKIEFIDEYSYDSPELSSTENFQKSSNIQSQIVEKESYFEQKPVPNEHTVSSATNILTQNNNKNKIKSNKRGRGRPKVEEKKIYECPYCHVTHKKRYRSQHHINVKHLKMPSVSRDYLCSVCGKILSNRSSYIDHYKRHFPDLLFTCQYCDKKFTSNFHCVQHEKMHTNDKQLFCNQCDYKCIRRSQLKVS